MRLYLKGSDINNTNYNISQYQIKPSISTNTIYGSSNLQNSQYTFNLNLMNVLGSDYRNKDKFNIKVLDIRNINENVISTGTDFTNISVANINWRSVAYNPTTKRYIAVAGSGTGNRFMYSDNNGSTWTTINTTGFDNSYASIIYGKNEFVVISSTGTSRIRVSTDNGITWLNVTIPLYNYRSLTYSNTLDRYCAITNEGNIITCDGSAVNTWIERINNVNYAGLCVIWGKNLFVACNQGPAQRIITSPDGITWTLRTVGSGSYRTICYNIDRDEYLAIPTSGVIGLTSKDGITWTSYNVNLGSIVAGLTYSTIKYLPDVKIYIIAGASTNVGYLFTSINGIFWTQIATGNDVIYDGITSNNLGNIVLCGNNGLNAANTNRCLISNVSQNIIDYTSQPHLRTSNIFIKGLNFCNNKSENLLGYFTNINSNEELSIDVVIRYNMGNFTMFIRSNTDNVLGYQSYDFVDIFFDKTLSHLSSYPQRLIFKNTYNQAILNILDNKIFTIKDFTFDNSNYILTCVFEDPAVPASYTDVGNGNFPITIQTLPLVNQWYYVNRNDKHNNPDNSNLELSAYINKQNPYINLSLELRDVMTDTLQPVINETNNKVYPNLEFILDIN
jgi:hypothetical protein